MSKLALTALAVVFALGAAEVGLRVAGFSHRIKPERVEFGWPHPRWTANPYDTDPLLFWVPKDYSERLQRLEPGVLDIAFLGDSCTEFGEYPERFVKALESRRPGISIAAETFGVGGWSSYQGLEQFRRDILPLRPKVATFYFGWNDHWIGFGVEDKELAPVAALDPGRLRLGQLVLKVQLGYLVRRRSHRPERVAQEDYRDNLRQFSRLARDSGIVPVLLTAPTSLIPGREPGFLAGRFVRRLEDLVPLHHQYLAIVRDVAAEEGAVLCDLARDFESFPRARLENELFNEDGIHLTPAGDEQIARLLLDCFDRHDELSRLGVDWSDPSARELRPKVVSR